MPTAFESIDEVIESNLCIGCGACASIDGSNTKMSINENGMFQPIQIKSTPASIKIHQSQVCPFSSIINETELSKKLFPQSKYRKIIGSYVGLYTGYVNDPTERQESSSGGIATWTIEQLFKRDMIDGVAHVKTASKEDLFKYTISRSIDEIKAGRKTRYYPTEISSVIQEIRNTPGRYAITGVPCYIKAIQLLRSRDPILRERIVFTIGLVCGHMKSRAYTEWLAWEAGINPADSHTIDYRHKNLDQPANNYSTLIQTKSVTTNTKNSDLPLNKWGYGLFKPNACEYCDDVFAETADICVGDAWLPQYISDPLGTNIVIVRNEGMMKIFDSLRTVHSPIHLDKVTPEVILSSQLGGIRHRTQGLAHRLARNTQFLKLKKRTNAKSLGNTSAGKMYDMRNRISKESHELFKKAKSANSIEIFRYRIKELTEEYEHIYIDARRTLKDRLSQAIEKSFPAIHSIIITSLKITRKFKQHFLKR